MVLFGGGVVGKGVTYGQEPPGSFWSLWSDCGHLPWPLKEGSPHDLFKIHADGLFEIPLPFGCILKQRSEEKSLDSVVFSDFLRKLKLRTPLIRPAFSPGVAISDKSCAEPMVTLSDIRQLLGDDCAASNALIAHEHSGSGADA